MITSSEYIQKKKILLQDIKSAVKTGQPIALRKKTTNLFRARDQGKVARLDVTGFTNVISIDAKSKTAEVEGMATYETIVEETLKYGLMPAVVPQLKTITLGGAVTGVGIESSSFKYGFPHETLLSMEILTGDGKIVEAKPAGAHKELFFGFPNSYGSLGYAIKLKISLVPVKKYVKLTHIRYTSSQKYFVDLKQVCDSHKWQNKPVEFVDGMIYRRSEYYIVIGQMVDDAPYVSDYTYKYIYYKSIVNRSQILSTKLETGEPGMTGERSKEPQRSRNISTALDTGKFGMTGDGSGTDYLTIKDYIWRWDTDWFWCSKGLGAQNPVLRRLYGKGRLRSDRFMKLFNFEMRHGYKQKLDKLFGKKPIEYVIQDVEIPIENCEEFIDYYFKTINILPAWVCPVRQLDKAKNWSLYNLNPNKLYVNFGFWSSVEAKSTDLSWHNKSLEAKVTELGGKKSLYSSSYYDKNIFWKLYNSKVYNKLKSQYDPQKSLKGLYEKTVKRG